MGLHTILLSANLADMTLNLPSCSLLYSCNIWLLYAIGTNNITRPMIRMLLSCSYKKEEFHDIGFVKLFTRQTEDGQGIWCEGLIYFLYLSEALFESKGTLYIVCILMQIHQNDLSYRKRNQLPHREEAH